MLSLSQNKEYEKNFDNMINELENKVPEWEILISELYNEHYLLVNKHKVKMNIKKREIVRELTKKYSILDEGTIQEVLQEQLDQIIDNTLNSVDEDEWNWNLKR